MVKWNIVGSTLDRVRGQPVELELSMCMRQHGTSRGSGRKQGLVEHLSWIQDVELRRTGPSYGGESVSTGKG